MTNDPDIQTARQIAVACNSRSSPDWKRFCREGFYDDDTEIQIALMGIKVGRGLDALPAVLEEAE